jgi:membrane protease YdiL (CAAX protease family)
VGSIGRIFWNAEQHRLRTFWRLLIWALVWVLLLIIFQVVIGIAIAATALASGELTQQQLFDPDAINDYIANHVWLMPILRIGQTLITLGAVWLAGRFLDRRKFADFGLRLNRDWWVDFGFGLFLGAILMAIVFGVERAVGWVTITGSFTAPQGSTFVLAIVLAVLTFVLVGIDEELFSRGYQLTNMAEGFNWKGLGPQGAIIIATLLSSAIFGMLHLGNPNATAISTFNIFLAGILLASGYILTGKLAIPIGLHITWNFFQGNVFGFPVSGTSANTTSFIAIEQSGPELWTGGAFGPEAGLIGIIAMAIGLVLTLLWVDWRYGQIGLHLALAEAPKPATQNTQDAGSVNAPA